MTGLERAIQIANKVLGNTDDFGSVDPDGDLAVLARQLLKLCEPQQHQYMLRGASVSFAYSALADRYEKHRHVIVWASCDKGFPVSFHIPRLLAGRMASDIQRVVGDGLPAPIGDTP